MEGVYNNAVEFSFLWVGLAQPNLYKSLKTNLFYFLEPIPILRKRDHP